MQFRRKLEVKFDFLFKQLNIAGKTALVNKYVHAPANK